MRLGIITDCIHYKHPDGRIGTENHILLRQFESLACYFSKTTIACAFDRWDESKVISWYNTDFDFIEMPVVGGERMIDKIKILSVIPKWLKVYAKVNQCSDIVYQRFPNNVNLPGFFYFYFKKKKVFATFTGTWLRYEGEPATYRLQKWLLKHFFRGPVWVYTAEETNSKKIIQGYSPSYSLSEWHEEAEQVAQRIIQLQSKGLPLIRMITVGTLIDYKNQIAILKACRLLQSKQIPFRLLVVGDGPMFSILDKYIKENDLCRNVELAGKMNYQELRALYRQSDFVVQAPLKEGFGKVPIEGLFHGVIPVLNNLSMASYMTGKGERGFLFEDGNPENLAELLIQLHSTINLLPGMILKGREFAKHQTLESWSKEYYEKVTEYFTIS